MYEHVCLTVQRAVARMLFWGQQGVSSDIQTAVRHYERGATRLQDPVSMYDYAIVLLMVSPNYVSVISHYNL